MKTYQLTISLNSKIKQTFEIKATDYIQAYDRAIEIISANKGIQYIKNVYANFIIEAKELGETITEYLEELLEDLKNVPFEFNQLIILSLVK